MKSRVVRRIGEVVGVVLAVFVVLGLTSPRVVPRLALFPAPAAYSYCSNSSGHTRVTARRSGPIWGWDAVGDLMLCDRALRPAADVP